MSRTLIVGDLHGCYDEAVELLDRAQVTTSDRVIFTGDLVDRGPKRRECVELAMKHASVLGNHEEKHLRLRRLPDFLLSPDQQATRRALEPRHLDWFATLPTFIRLPEYGAVVVHAGVMPNRAVEAQDRYHLLHCQCIKPPSRKSYWPSKAPADFRFWSQLWTGPERVVFGHTVLHKPLPSPFAVGIDTGVVHGRTLTGVLLPEWRLIEVSARRDYVGPKGFGRYPVQGDVVCFS